MKKCVGLLNDDNFVGQALKAEFLNDDRTCFLDLNEINKEVIVNSLGDLNWFVFNTDFMDEREVLRVGDFDFVMHKLTQLYSIVRLLTDVLLSEGKTAQFIFMTVNPAVMHLIDFPVSPIYDESVHTFSKSLAKEFASFGLVFNVVCMEPVFEMLDLKKIRTYRQTMSVFASKKGPLKSQQIAGFVYRLLESQLDLCSGHVFCIGKGMVLSY